MTRIDELGNVEIAIVVSVGALRSVLRNLRADGRQWWIATHPLDALEDGKITLGFGDRRCKDVLNRAFFRLPVVGESSSAEPNRSLLLFDASVITPEEGGYYLEKGRFVRDSVSNFEDFFAPVKKELVNRLLDGPNCCKERK